MRGAHHHLQAGQRGDHPGRAAAGHGASQPPADARQKEGGDGAAQVPPQVPFVGVAPARQVSADALRQGPERHVRGAVRSARPDRLGSDAAEEPRALLRVHPQAGGGAQAAQVVRLPPRAGSVHPDPAAEDFGASGRGGPEGGDGDVLGAERGAQEGG